MKKPNVRCDHVTIVECHLSVNPCPKMTRNFRKHVNRIKKTKWAFNYLTSGKQPKGKRPDFPAFRDFIDMGFDIPSAHCPAVTYQCAACEKAVLELYQEFLVAEKNGETSSELVGGRL